MSALDGDVAMGGDEPQVLPAAHLANGHDETGAMDLGEDQKVGSNLVPNGNHAETHLGDQPIYPQSLQRKGLLPTGCCYDDRMKLHVNAEFGVGSPHPEAPERIEAIMSAFKSAGLIFTGKPSEIAQILRDTPTRFMWRIAAREASRAEIETVHLPAQFDWVERLSTLSTHELRKISAESENGRLSLYVGSMSFEAALISAGGAIETCKSVVAGHVKNAFAVIRPPGHHAEYDTSMGFCMFNNVPIAARICQADYPEICRKILILDWDVHHGNGIQNMFYNDPNILYISLHVYRNGDFYPGKSDNPDIPDGDISCCGIDEGLGKNVNIGWPDQGMGDGEYLAAFQKIVMPIAQEFDPDLVIISAGFDAADGDELGACFVTPECYAHMTHMLMSLANGKVAVCLEGGYNLKAISSSALAVAQTLMGEPPPRIQMPNINAEAARVLAKVQAFQAPYWKCMRPGVVNVPDTMTAGGVRLHDTIRAYQRQNLAETHGMVPLYVQRETLFKSYENQVLVTPDLMNARKVLIIIHDPPDLMAQPDPLNNSIDAHNTWLSDGVRQYIDWAVDQKFGIMDINVPRYISHAEDIDPHIPKATEREISIQTAELMSYLWDNYIQLYENADELFVMGVGDAYLGVKQLLTGREASKHKISGVINFVNGSLLSVRSETDATLSSWYREHAQIYVAADHAVWADPQLARKVSRKRYGTVVRSPQIGLNRMMKEHAGEVYAWILERIRPETGDTTEDDKE